MPRTTSPAFAFGATSSPAAVSGAFNGLRYMLLPHALGRKQLSLRLCVPCGCLDEYDDELGFAHLLEHMMISQPMASRSQNGCVSLFDWARLTGGLVNACTSWAQTTYKLDQIPSGQLGTALELLGAIGEGQIQLTEGILAREKQIVLSEIGQKNTPNFRSDMAEVGHWFQGESAAARSPLGCAQSVASATLDRVRLLYQRRYRLAGACLIVVGDIQRTEVEDILLRFCDGSSQRTSARAPRRASPAQQDPIQQIGIYVETGVKAAVSLAWRVDPARAGEQARSREDIETVLQAALRRQVALSASDHAISPNGVSAGLMRIPGARSVRALEVAHLVDDWPNALSALNAARCQLLKPAVGHQALLEAASSMATRAARQATAFAGTPSSTVADQMAEEQAQPYRWTSPQRRAEDLAALVVSLDGGDQLDKLEQALDIDKALVMIKSPRSVRSEAASNVARQLREPRRVAEVVKTAPVDAWPYAGVFGTSSGVSAPPLKTGFDITLAKFGNGARMAHKRTSGAPGQILVAVQFGQGRLGMPTDVASRDWALPALFEGGLRRMPLEAIRVCLQGASFSAALATLDDAFQVTGRTVDTDLARQLEFFSAHFVDADWRADGFERRRSEALANIGRPCSAFDALRRDLPSLVRNFDQRWRAPGSQELLNTPLACIRDMVGSAMSDGPPSILIAGDIAENVAVEAVERTFGALDLSDRRAAPSSQPQVRFPQPVDTPFSWDAGLTGDRGLALVGWALPDHTYMGSGASLFRLLEMWLIEALTERVRDLGIAYAVRTQLHHSKAARGFGYLVAFAELARTDFEAFFGAADATLDSLSEGSFGQFDLCAASRSVLERTFAARQSNAYWLEHLRYVHDIDGYVENLASSDHILWQTNSLDLLALSSTYVRRETTWRLQI